MRLPRTSLVFALGMAFALTAWGSPAQAQVKPKFESKLVTPATPGQSIKIEADIKGAKSLFLVVQDGGDSFGCDWADWIEPKLVSAKGETKLTELKWKSASAGFGKVTVNANCNGQPLRVAGKVLDNGIGTHSTSVIEYALPETSEFTKFIATGAVDDGGVSQGCGSTVKFLVFTEKPDAKVLVASAAANDLGSRDPKDAIKGLDVADGLEATLFASEASGLLSPSDIDIDHLGRVWVCEVVNYRHRNGERPAGDRILIVEDTDGDGVSDKQSVFYQGRDVDTALGICVLPTPSGKGTKVIVSVAPNVIQFTDVDGNLKFDPAVDKKEMLFTKVGQPQHDHSTHAFVFGPDGKYYWNVGNTGIAVHDKDGNIVKDLAGNEVRDGGKPYWGGMVFRCNADGSEFETLAHNFRNNYEVTVDSFGTLWQSDNDDDGNRGVRINYVMEFGNFGYRDEVTGAAWTTPRTNLEADKPLQHWHLNDPGVVPNLVQTGAGSPTGICMYEGSLLPEVFRNQVIHCDAGPNVVRAYPAKKSGAGYTAEIVNILTGSRDNWFRPSDVCVAPDGSLIVADWYDPGVGGHRMGDIDKGRLFRVAPPKTAYKTPKVDVSTVEGAIEALKSPNLAARYMAWTALHEMGQQAVPALVKMVEEDPNPRFRARALWLLSKAPGTDAIQTFYGALKPGAESTEDLRIVVMRAIREMRQPGTVLPGGLQDSAQLRRDVVISLRGKHSDSSDVMWARVAQLHQATDRWHLEALGIGADGRWDQRLAAYFKIVPKAIDTDAGRDIIWRSRASQTPQLLVQILSSPETTLEKCPRYLRAFDFLAGSTKDDALIHLAFGNFGDDAKTKFINSEALSRLQGFDISKNEQQKVALNRVLDGLKGQTQFLTLVDKFSVSDRYEDVALLAAAKPDDQIGIDAARLLLAKRQFAALDVVLKSGRDNGRTALGMTTALSNTGDGAAAALLLPLVKDSNMPVDQRRQAIKGATRTKSGAAEVLKLVEAKAFDETFGPALAAGLQSAPLSAEQQAEVTKLFPAPEGKDAKPLPSLAELAMLKGNVDRGAKLFATTGKCATCHIVNNQGKEVGPNLSEIGSKLSRQAMFESIIFPSAGISHNYESFVASLKDGTVFNGILVSETADAVTLRNNEAITKTIARNDLDEIVKQKISLMPADLAKLLSIEELADITEYLTTLKKK